MFKVFIVADETEPIRKLKSELGERGFTCSITPDGENAIEEVIEQARDLILIAVDGSSASPRVWSLPRRIKQERHLPTIALLSRGALNSLDLTASMDDFVVAPWDVTEVAARAKRILWRINNIDNIDNRECIKCGDLVIDLARYEVYLNGQHIPLTFKEYELLRFLASNKNRVFTREALLNKVWGYDYYGGDRTVDVHIRRLRSKIEDSTHTFIETVRNIGYKFKENV